MRRQTEEKTKIRTDRQKTEGSTYRQNDRQINRELRENTECQNQCHSTGVKSLILAMPFI